MKNDGVQTCFRIPTLWPDEAKLAFSEAVKSLQNGVCPAWVRDYVDFGRGSAAYFIPPSTCVDESTWTVTDLQDFQHEPVSAIGQAVMRRFDLQAPLVLQFAFTAKSGDTVTPNHMGGGLIKVTQEKIYYIGTDMLVNSIDERGYDNLDLFRGLANEMNYIIPDGLTPLDAWQLYKNNPMLLEKINKNNNIINSEILNTHEQDVYSYYNIAVFDLPQNWPIKAKMEYKEIILSLQNKYPPFWFDQWLLKNKNMTLETLINKYGDIFGEITIESKNWSGYIHYDMDTSQENLHYNHEGAAIVGQAIMDKYGLKDPLIIEVEFAHRYNIGDQTSAFPRGLAILKVTADTISLFSGNEVFYGIKQDGSDPTDFSKAILKQAILNLPCGTSLEEILPEVMGEVEEQDSSFSPS